MSVLVYFCSCFNLTIDLNVFEITNEISKTNTIKDILERKKAESENGLDQVEETA